MMVELPVSYKQVTVSTYKSSTVGNRFYDDEGSILMLTVKQATNHHKVCKMYIQVGMNSIKLEGAIAMTYSTFLQSLRRTKMASNNNQCKYFIGI